MNVTRNRTNVTSNRTTETVPPLSSLRTRFGRFELLYTSVWSKSIANLFQIWKLRQS